MKKTFLFITLLAVGCTSVKPDDNSLQTGNGNGNTSSGQINKPAEGNITVERPAYRATETILTDLVHTKLEVSFNWTKSQMTGKETLTAKPHFYPSDKLILDAKGMEIKSVKMNGNACLFTYEKDVLTITLNKVYQRNEEYTVVIDYLSKPDERITEGSSAITSDKGLYFINPKGEDATKMPQIWTQGETEASSVWFPTIDAPNVKTKQEMFITVDDKYATLSNGKLVDSQKNADGTRTDHWKQDLPHAPYLFMMGIGEFKVVKDTYKRADGTLMEVSYYVEPEWEKYGKDIFGETPRMIGFFSQLLGIEYPWDKYHQIVVRDYVSGAMENTGAVIFGDYVYKTDRELLDEDDNSTIAHELFHHWFGDLVTCESWSNLPLNESFANYSQYLWDEHRYGPDEADYNANAEMEGYFQSAAVAGYHDLIWFSYADKEDMFDGHSYNKGGRILHMLRNYLGDEAFFLGMQNYLKANAYKPAEFHQLRLAFEEVSGEDLNWFFNQWFLASGHPELNVEYSVSGNKVTINVQQKQDLSKFPIFRLPVDVMVFDEKGSTKHRIVIDQVSQSFELPFSGNLNNVLFDSQAMLLGEIIEKKESSWYVHQYYNSHRWRHRRDALNLGIKGKSPEAMQMVLDAMNDPFWDIRLKAIEKGSSLLGVNRVAALDKMKTMVHADSSSAVRNSLISNLTAALSTTEVQPILEKSIREDRSYTVISTALAQLGKFNPITAMKLAKPLEQEPSSKMMLGIAVLYVKNGTAENYPFYERILTTGALQGYDGTSALNACTVFLGDQDITVLRKALKIFEYQAKNGNMYTKLYYPGCVNYIIKKLNEKIPGFEEEEQKAKQSGNSNAADIARSKKSEAEALIKTYQALSDSVEKETSEKQH